MARVIRSPLAEADLFEIWLYIAQDNQEAADRMLDRIEAACRRLATSPRIGFARPELGAGIRSFPVGQYVIFYRKDRRGVEIARVLSGYRDIRTLM